MIGKVPVCLAHRPTHISVQAESLNRLKVIEEHDRELPRDPRSCGLTDHGHIAITVVVAESDMKRIQRAQILPEMF